MDENSIPIDNILGNLIPLDLMDGNSIPIDKTQWESIFHRQHPWESYSHLLALVTELRIKQKTLHWLAKATTSNVRVHGRGRGLGLGGRRGGYGVVGEVWVSSGSWRRSGCRRGLGLNTKRGYRCLFAQCLKLL